MGIQQDAAEILALVYKAYKKSDLYDYMHQVGYTMITHSDELLKALPEWDMSRLKKAVIYLIEKNMIEATIHNSILIDKIKPDGIDVVENKGKFKKTFGVELNLILGKIKWEAREK